MTTKAATNSASPGTSNHDSPPIQDVEFTTEPVEDQQPRPQQQHQSKQAMAPSPQQPDAQQKSLNDIKNNNASDMPPLLSPPSLTPNETTPAETATTSSLSASAAPATTSATKQQSPSPQQSQSANSHNNTEQKRPMNAFLLFCKRQRSSVREKYPNLENRGITKILGDWWSKLDKEQKSKYTDLARQHKEAFMKANPDFKWCKTPNVSNINNNSSNNNTNTNTNTNTNSNSNSNDCYSNNATKHQQQQQQQFFQRHQQNYYPTSATNAELLSLQSAHHHVDVSNHSSNSLDVGLTPRQQLEAPKPPKKRFLERNDSIYTSRNNSTSNQPETNSHGTDVVPYISLDQDTLDRVIDKAFSEDSNNSPSGTNTCKCSTRTPTNLTSPIGANPSSFSSSTSTSAYSTSADEPVDFSMNRTINATRQQIINNLVEKMLSEPTDNGGSFSKTNGTSFSVKSHTTEPLVRKINPDDT